MTLSIIVVSIATLLGESAAAGFAALTALPKMFRKPLLLIYKNLRFRAEIFIATETGAEA
jgi:hypothetical protein